MSTEDHPDWWRPVGGQNSQDSTLERRSLMWNDNDVGDGEDPPAYFTCEVEKGKFFPRGCRGMIEQIQIYCRDAGVNRITLRCSPHPGLGPIHTIPITPLGTWAWRGGDVEQMWNYDSLFVWVHACAPGVDWAYDDEQPHDGHETLDDGHTYEDLAIRPFIRVVYTGETAGDVPVSGTLNVVEIPSVATLVSEADGTIAHDTPVNTLIALGSGTMIEARVTFETSITPTPGDPPAAVVYRLGILADCVLTVVTSNRDLTQSDVATAGRSSVGEFYQMAVVEPAYHRTVLTLRLPIKFRRGIALYIYQSTGGPVDYETVLHANLIR